MKIVLNSNKEVVNKIRKMLKENNGYCPCSIIKTNDTKCMCKQFRDQVEKKELGFCHCELYELINED